MKSEQWDNLEKVLVPRLVLADKRHENGAAVYSGTQFDDVVRDVGLVGEGTVDQRLHGLQRLFPERDELGIREEGRTHLG